MSGSSHRTSRLVVPRQYYDLYPLDRLPERKLDPAKGYVRHPWLQRMDDFQQVDRNLTADERLKAVAAYFGLCTFVDSLIGEVLETLETVGLGETTRVVYTSDHGDNVGARGLWGKSNMYEESAGIPLIFAGPDVTAGTVCDTPVSLLDAYPTILAAAGLAPTEGDATLSGRSWLDIAGAPYDPDRAVFGEYHAAASPSAAFMVRRGHRKLIYYVGHEPELFDLSADPEETVDLAVSDPSSVAEYAAILRAICDPERVDRMAKDDQNALTDRYGGPEAAFTMGTPGATPVPGQKPE